jgi:hypothetical protein
MTQDDHKNFGGGGGRCERREEKFLLIFIKLGWNNFDRDHDHDHNGSKNKGLQLDYNRVKSALTKQDWIQTM